MALVKTNKEIFMRNEKTRAFLLRLPKGLYLDLKLTAKIRKCSMNSLVVEGITKYLDGDVR